MDLAPSSFLSRLFSCALGGDLPQALKDRHPQIPWRDVQDFRNVAAHAYTGIDLDIVWRIVAGELYHSP